MLEEGIPTGSVRHLPGVESGSAREEGYWLEANATRRAQIGSID